jgi:hypothetical protein
LVSVGVASALGGFATGATVSLSWTKSASSTATGYQIWFGTESGNYGDFVDVGAKTTGTVTDLVPGQTNYLSVWAYDKAGNFSPFANEVQYMPPLPPIITPQPPSVTATKSSVTITPGASVTVAPGANVTFKAAVTGDGLLTFQWRQGNTVLRGQNTNSLWLAAVTAANAGQYTLVVSNAGGAVTSDPMTLAIKPLQAGTYNGLFYLTNGDGSPAVSMESAGMLGNLAINSSGTYSGKLYLGNSSFPVAGTIDPYGNSEITVSRVAVAQPSLDVKLHLDSTLSSGQVTGSVSNMTSVANNRWCASVLGDSAAPGSLLSVDLGVTLTSADGSASAGIDYISLLGQGSALGQLSDGAVFSQAAPLSIDGDLPIYASLYGGVGLVEGWLSLSNGTPTGSLTWIRLSGAAQNPPGFTNFLQSPATSP